MSEIDLSSPLNYGTPGSLSSVRTPHSGIRGTPIRMRPDIRTDRRIRQVNVNSDPVCILAAHNKCIWSRIQAESWVMLFGDSTSNNSMEQSPSWEAVNHSASQIS